MRQYAADLRAFVKEALAQADLAATLPSDKDFAVQLKKVEAAFDLLAVPKFPEPVVQQALTNLYKAAADSLARSPRVRGHVEALQAATRLQDAELIEQAQRNLHTAIRNLRGILDQIAEAVEQ